MRNERKHIRLRNFDYSTDGSYFITICTKNGKHFFGEIENDEMFLNQIGIIATEYLWEIPNHFAHAELDEFIVMPNHIHLILHLDKSFGMGMLLDNLFPPVSPIPPFPPVGIRQVGSLPGEMAESMEPMANEQVESSIPSQPFPTSDYMWPEPFSPLEHDVPIPVGTRHVVSLPDAPGVPFAPDAPIIPIPPAGPQIPNPSKHHTNQFSKPIPGSVSVIIQQFKSSVTRWCNDNGYKFRWQSKFYDHIIRNEESYQRIKNYIFNNPKKWNNDSLKNNKK